MNILILDDEQLIRDNVYHQVITLDLGIDQVFEACNAQNARHILETNAVDIFLCDIVMPEEDGISFAKWTLARYPDSKFIFLTAHSDFEYTKEAISLRSFDYILQPAPIEELRDVLTRAIMQIKLEEDNRKLLEDASFYKENDANILEILGGRYLFGISQDREFFDRYVKQVWKSIPNDLTCFPCYMKALSPEDVPEGRSLLCFMYKNIIDEIMAPLSMESVIFLDDEFICNALILLRGEHTQEDIQDVIKALDTIRILFQKLLGISVVIYASGFCHYHEIRKSVSNILDKMKSVVRDVSCICLTESETEQNSRNQLAIQADSWRVLLTLNRIEDFRVSLMTYLSQHTEARQVSRDFLLKLHQQISELILKKIVASGLKTDEVFDDEISYYDFMSCTNDFQTFVNVITVMIDRLSAKLEKRERDPIDETIRYIHENIDRDISVSELAEIVGVTPEYFSRLFKKSTGINLKKYIVNEKMEAAKILLTTTDLSVTTISGHVGYNNYSNFTHTFKLLFDESPKEYRAHRGTTDK